jgi:hypothetical protein
MSRFHGPQHAGALREHRRRKRAEATNRNAATARENRRWWRQAEALSAADAAAVLAAKGPDVKVARQFRLSPLTVALIRQMARGENT